MSDLHRATRHLMTFGELEVGETRPNIGTGTAGIVLRCSTRAGAASPVAAMIAAERTSGRMSG